MMYAKSKNAIAAVASVALISTAPVFAVDEVQLGECGGSKATVHVSGMGMVTAEHLQKHMEKMQDDLEKARRTQAASSAHRKLLEQHMQDMEGAMEKVQAAVTQQSCPPGSVTIDARVERLEQRVDALQKLLDQMIGHQREAERSGR